MNIWNFILNKLNNNQEVILLTIIKSNGSSPGRQGFKMAISEDNELNGSIGGGVVEYDLAEQAKKLLKLEKKQPFIKHLIHKENVKENKSGLICSGNQDIAFYPLNKNHKPLIEQIINSLKSENKLILSILNNNLKIDIDNTSELRFFVDIKDENNWIYKEELAYENIMYIIGAGHVGLALSETIKQLDFKLIVLDNRKDLNTYNTNNFADVKKIVNYNNIDKYIKEGDNIFVVIMTFSHALDKLILGKLANKNFAYLGLMGSTKKIEGINKKLIDEGISAESLNKVYSPIGIQIHSKTPAEIAISIAAEIIKIKNENK